VQRSLPEMNALTTENKLPFPVYAVHAEGKVDKALALMDSTDVNGKPWKLDFVFGDKSLNERLAVAGYPSYYVIDDKARPRAFILGHPEDTVGTLQWLIDEIKKRG